MLEANRVNPVLGCNDKNCDQPVKGGESPPLSCTGETLPAVLHQSQKSQHRKGINLFQCIQKRTIKMVRGLEDFSAGERLRVSVQLRERSKEVLLQSFSI